MQEAWYLLLRAGPNEKSQAGHLPSPSIEQARVGACFFRVHHANLLIEVMIAE
jgi:hypothetical protein